MSNTNDNASQAFENDIRLWQNISGSFGDIVAETNVDDHFEWHVTIQRNGYQFHFMVFWNEKCPIQQPKICLLFDQRRKISSPDFNGCWLMLKDLKLYTVTSVLLGMRKCVGAINLTNVDKNLFNNRQCLYCHFGEQDNKMDSVSNNVSNSVSNSSVLSLTVSQASNISINTSKDKEILTEMAPKENKVVSKSPSIVTKNETSKIIRKTPAPKKSVKPKIIKHNNIVKNNNMVKNNIIGKKNNNSKKPRTMSWSDAVSGTSNKTNKMAVRYLDVDRNGRLVWKWTIGRRP